ncbi:hypothetical protein FHT76_007632 [Rhizobium sp. BK176]|nr:hypothetical protein [Rhizobium sp. BK661]MCS4095911.1 hypothetical protein [Rhizobium sp. BK176]
MVSAASTRQVRAPPIFPAAITSPLMACAGYAPYSGLRSFVFVSDQLTGETIRRSSTAHPAASAPRRGTRVRRLGETLKLAGE